MKTIFVRRSVRKISKTNKYKPSCFMKNNISFENDPSSGAFAIKNKSIYQMECDALKGLLKLQRLKLKIK